MNSLVKILLLLLLTSCSRRTALTTSVQSVMDDRDMARIQYYVSDDILLYETSEDSKVRVIDGKIVNTSMSESDMIVIRKNTPGVLVKLDKKDNLGISFETTDGRFIYFTPNGEVFTMSADEWKQTSDGPIGILRYGGRKYYTDAGHVFLTVKMKEVRYARNKQRTLKGRRL